MMIGYESSLSDRRKAQQKYALELEEQIKLKKSNYQESYDINKKNYDTYSQPSRSNSSFTQKLLNDYSASNNNGYSGKISQKSLTSFSPIPLSNFSSSIPPFNFNFGSSSAPSTYIYSSKFSSLNNQDQSTFPNRLEKLALAISQISDSIENTDKFTKSNISQQIQKIGADINQIGNNLNNFSSTIIPNMTSKSFQQIHHIRSLIDSSNSLNERILQLRNQFSEIDSSITSFKHALKSIDEASRSSIINSKPELIRIKNHTEQSFKKLDKMKQKLDFLVQLGAQVNSDFNNVDSRTINSFSQLQQILDKSTADICSHFATQVQQASELRIHDYQSIQKSIETSNITAIESFTKCHKKIQEIHDLFMESLISFHDSIEQAFNQTLADNDSLLIHMHEQIDQLIDQFLKNFSSITEDMILTIKAMNTFHNRSQYDIASSFDQEAKIRNQNFKEILSRYQNFQSVIENEMGLHDQNRDKLFSDVVQRGFTHATKLISMITPDIRSKEDPNISISQLIANSEEKLLEAEAKWDASVTVIKEQISYADKSILNLENQLKTIKSQIISKYDIIDSKILKVQRLREAKKDEYTKNEKEYNFATMKQIHQSKKEIYNHANEKINNLHSKMVQAAKLMISKIENNDKIDEKIAQEFKPIHDIINQFKFDGNLRLSIKGDNEKTSLQDEKPNDTKAEFLSSSREETVKTKPIVQGDNVSNGVPDEFADDEDSNIEESNATATIHLDNEIEKEEIIRIGDEQQSDHNKSVEPAENINTQNDSAPKSSEIKTNEDKKESKIKYNDDEKRKKKRQRKEEEEDDYYYTYVYETEEDKDENEEEDDELNFNFNFSEQAANMLIGVKEQPNDKPKKQKTTSLFKKFPVISRT